MTKNQLVTSANAWHVGKAHHPTINILTGLAERERERESHNDSTSNASPQGTQKGYENVAMEYFMRKIDKNTFETIN